MTEDKFILMGLDDARSKDIAEALGNKTCRKIIDHLAEVREASEKDISDALGIPISTIEYNLNKLVKTGLVQCAKNFFWSRKGRRIDMFKLAKKYIVISPKLKRVDMKELRTILPVILIAAVLIVLISLAVIPQFNNKSGFVLTKESKLKQFSSYEELNNFLNQTASAGRGRTDAIMGFSNALAPSTAGAAKSSADSSAEPATSYSHTNIQVEGVDEADIVKNDGKYIYTLSGNKVVIVEAYPAVEMKKLSEISFSNARNIFLNGDKLIVFEDSYGYIPYESSNVRCLGYRCGGYSETKTHAYIYDISDREKPVLENNMSFDGNYEESRMIGNYVYVISSKNAYAEHPMLVYSTNGVEKSIPINDIYYTDYIDDDYVFKSINAINLENNNLNSKVYLVGGSGQIYVSEYNIYLSYQKSINWDDYNDRKLKEVYMKIAPQSLKEKINEIISSNTYHYDKQSQVSNLVYKYSISLIGVEKENFDSKLSKAMEEFEDGLAKERDKSIVHKINVDKLDINYESAGEFSGHILNQFSMDEYKGNLRVATTSGETWNGNSLNHVYILDENLNLIGKLEDLAHGEKIYSVRFAQERAYIVTFKKVDPLFVIDVSDARNPKVLGYLKIPGYSDYLHPYDENHVIGIGKDAVDASESSSRNLDFAWYQGVKISLFDVSDVENPYEQGKIIIGDRGTDSLVLSDHKALLFNKEKKVLVIPVSVAQINRSKYRKCSNEELENYNSYNYCLTPHTYGEQVWQGAYVLNIDLENGVSVRGKVTHFDNEPKENEYEWRFFDYRYQIQRSLFMDNVLYTVSQSKIKANDLNSLNEINKVELGYKENFAK